LELESPMNHLAHIFLADPTPESRAGNFGADYFKGAVGKHDPRLQASIRLHRAVDAFTDHHPAVRSSKARVRNACGNLSGVVIDVVYDHVLARRWSSYSTEPLELWTRSVYGQLLSARDLLPPPLQSALPRMIADDWLMRYREFYGVERALGYLLRRLGRDGGELRPMLDAARRSLSDLDGDFDQFFPELIAHARKVEFGV
jgi:acyl carrier protein phosphodiesterase